MKYNTIIFGSGYHGRMALRKCSKKKSNYKVLCFIDNDKKKHNKFCLKKKIFGVNRIKKIDYEKIIFCGRHIKNQLLQLKKFKVEKSKFIFWGKKELRLNKSELKQRSKFLFKILSYIIKYFEKKKIDYWLDYSGLLSLLRKQDLAELSDVEISINVKDANKINNFLNKKNKLFKFYSKLILKSKYIKKKKFNRMYIIGKIPTDKIEPPIIDFINKNFMKKRVENIGMNKIFPSDFWESEKKINYKGLSIKVPSNPKKYLKLHYGNKWKQESEFWREKNNKKKLLSKKDFIIV